MKDDDLSNLVMVGLVLFAISITVLGLAILWQVLF